MNPREQILYDALHYYANQDNWQPAGNAPVDLDAGEHARRAIALADMQAKEVSPHHAYEYRTTIGMLVCNTQDGIRHELTAADPTPPSGDGWALANSHFVPHKEALGGIFVWFWQRSKQP